MTTANLTRAETVRRAAAIDVLGYRVELDLRAAIDPAVDTFTTRTTVEFGASADETWLDFLGAEVVGVTVNGNPVPVEYDGARIRLTGLTRVNGVTVDAVGLYSRTGEGLHRFVDPADGNTYLYTQYEPADARRVFACFEQPDLKAPFVFDVRVPDGWTVLSNQRPDAQHASRAVFEPTLPISTYITAVVAGPYHRATSSWQRGDLTVPLGAYCRASLAEHFDPDDLFEVTRQGLDFYADHFGYPYPFGKYDQVFVPEYNLGAMENPGCVTFTESYVFRGAATQDQYARRANTILHEMAHMWFGDLVTPVWWDDLWLKESFADLMGSLVSAEATRFTDAWVSFANRRKAWAYQQDQLPTTHPVVAEIPDLEAAKLNFDGITYAKGAAVLKQLMAHVGRDAFFTAARNYFQAFEFANTRLTDLLAALSAASGRDLAAWSRQWLESTGVSTLSWDGTHVVQTLPKPTTLAIGCYSFDETGDLVRIDRRAVELTEERTPIDLPSADLVLLNDEDLTYAKARLDERSLATVESSLDRLRDPLARGLVWSSVWNATRDAELAAPRFVSMVSRFAAGETDPALLAGVLANAGFAVEHFVADEGRAAARRAWLDTAWHNLHEAPAASDAQLTWARTVASAAAYDDARAADLGALLDGRTSVDGLQLDPDLRWALLTALAATGHVDLGELDAERARDDTGAGAIAHERASAARPLDAVKIAAWTSIFDDPQLSNDRIGALIGGFTTGARAPRGEEFADRYFAALLTTWSERSIEIARRIVVGLFPRTEDTRAVDSWLAAADDAPAALRRLVVEQRDFLRRDLDARRFDAEEAQR